MDTLIRLHRQLTLLTRQVGTAADVAAATFSEAIAQPLGDLYRLPIQDGIESIPQIGREDLIAWIGEILGASEAETAVLASVLATFSQRAFVTGGAVALADLGVPGAFTLRDNTIITRIDDFAAMLADIDGDISLVRTTANELGYAIDYGRQQEMSNSELSNWLALYIAGRTMTRSRNIGENETVRWSRAGETETFAQNGISHVIYRVHPELSATGPCPICEPYNGQRFEVNNGLVLFDIIPQHNNCVCDWEPDMSEWQLPEEVWTGG